jgi:ribosomal protein S18 acetylase RimI-like enzyme
MIEVRRLPADRWTEYKALRLEALASNPTAFGSSVEDEATLTEADWRRRTENAFFALSDEKPIGLIVLRVNPRLKTRHVAEIFGVYVRASERGKGVGKLLLESALKEAEGIAEVVKIRLNVNPEQRAAVELYRKAGFTVVGRLRRELKVEGRFYDELVMEKQIRS